MSAEAVEPAPERPARHGVTITANAAACPVCGWMVRRADVERELQRPLDDLSWEGHAAGLASVHLLRMGFVTESPAGVVVVPLQVAHS